MTTTKRVPKLGEVWTAPDGTPCTCIDDEADKIGRYGWSRPTCRDDGSVFKDYHTTVNLTPPDANPPEEMATRPWHPVYEGGGLGYTGWSHATGALMFSDRTAHREPVGAINVTTGEWVPK